MSFIDRKDENYDGKRLGIDEGFDIIEAARMEYGFSTAMADSISDSVRRFRDGLANELDMDKFVVLRDDMKRGVLRGRQNKAIEAIDRLEAM